MTNTELESRILQLQEDTGLGKLGGQVVGVSLPALLQLIADAVREARIEILSEWAEDLWQEEETANKAKAIDNRITQLKAKDGS